MAASKDGDNPAAPGWPRGSAEGARDEARQPPPEPGTGHDPPGPRQRGDAAHPGAEPLRVGGTTEIEGVDPPSAVRQARVQDADDLAPEQDREREIEAPLGLGRVGLELEIQIEQRLEAPA